METLQRSIAGLDKSARLSAAVEDIDKIIELLSEAREQVASSMFVLAALPLRDSGVLTA